MIEASESRVSYEMTANGGGGQGSRIGEAESEDERTKPRWSRMKWRPLKLLFYVNGERNYPGKSVLVDPLPHRHQFSNFLDQLTRCLPSTLPLPHGVRQVFNPVNGTKVKDVRQLEDGASYVCAGFEAFKPIAYGGGDQSESTSGNSKSLQNNLPSTTSEVLSREQLITPNRTHDKLIAPTTTSTTAMTPTRTHAKPRIITIFRYGLKPEDNLRILFNRSSVQSFEQFLLDVASAFDTKTTKGETRRRGTRTGSRKLRTLYDVRGKEIRGISDLFRDDDIFIGVGFELIRADGIREILDFLDAANGMDMAVELLKEWDKTTKNVPLPADVDTEKENKRKEIKEDGKFIFPKKVRRGNKNNKMAEKNGQNAKIKEFMRDDEVNNRTVKKINNYSTALPPIEKSSSREISTEGEQMRPDLSKRRAEILFRLNNDNRWRRSSVTSSNPANTAEKEKEENIETSMPLPDRSESAEERLDARKYSQRRSEVEFVEPEMNNNKKSDDNGNEILKNDNDNDEESDNIDYINDNDNDTDNINNNDNDFINSNDTDTDNMRYNGKGDLPPTEEATKEKPNVKNLDRSLSSSSGYDSQRIETDENDQQQSTSADPGLNKSENVATSIPGDSTNPLPPPKPRLPTFYNSTSNPNIEPHMGQVQLEPRNSQLFDSKNIQNSAEKSSVSKTGNLPDNDSFEYRTTNERRRIESVAVVEKMYDLGRTLGDGNFAVVKECRDRRDGKEYAMKIVDKSKLKGKESMIENEILILKACQHSNIVQLFTEYETNTEIFLLMEFVEGGDLFDFITQSGPFTEMESAGMVYDLSKALQYLHVRRIVHRDVKPENIIIHHGDANTVTLKLADFGLATEVLHPIYIVCGTPTYVAPEILTETGYGLEIDMWAVGVILYILICGFAPFRSQDQDQTELFDIIKSGIYEFTSPYWDNTSDGVRQLIDSLLQVNIKNRFTAADVICDEFVVTCAGSFSPPDLKLLQKNLRNELRKKEVEDRDSFKRILAQLN